MPNHSWIRSSGERERERERGGGGVKTLGPHCHATSSSHLATYWFKCDSLDCLVDMYQESDWLVQFNIKSACYHIDIWQPHTEYLCFNLRNIRLILRPLLLSFTVYMFAIRRDEGLAVMKPFQVQSISIQER